MLQLQDNQRFRYNQVMQALNMSAALTARKTKEFRSPPQEQVEFSKIRLLYVLKFRRAGAKSRLSLKYWGIIKTAASGANMSNSTREGKGMLHLTWTAMQLTLLMSF